MAEPIEPTGDFDPLDGIIAEYLQAIEAGQAPSRVLFLLKHPGHSERLEQFFRNFDAVGRDASKFRLPDPQATISVGGSGKTDLPKVRYLGDYELLSEIARGGMGVVYRARQVSLNRPVAVKMILAGTYATPEAVQRFRAEAEAAANLDHPNILPIYEVGEHEGHQYFSMKFVEGGSLSSKIAELQAKPKQIAELMATLAKAVHFAHQRGILHRDLKPANVLLDADGTPYVTDFGLAKKVDADDGSTRTGSIVGTPSYMSPEQARGEKDISTSSDVYSLGAVLYELLTGKPPFKGESVFATVKKVMETEAPDPRSVSSKADRDLSVIAMKCLRKETAARYLSAAELAQDLERWTRREPIVARPVGRAERLRMWVRRNPALAASFAAIYVSLVAGVLLLNYGMRKAQQGRDANEKLYEQASIANLESMALNAQVAESLAAEKRSSYFAKVNLAFNEWQLNNPLRADLLLDETDPSQRCWEFAFLRRVMHSERFSQDVDSRGLGVFVYSPDGKRIVTAGFDQRIRIWNASDGKLLQSIGGHTSPVLSVAFTPDGSRLLASSSKETILWDPATGKRLPWNGPTVGALRIARHADGRLAMTLKNKQIACYASGSDKPLWTAPGTTVAWVDGNRIAACVENRIALYDSTTGQEVGALSADSTPLKSAIVSADGLRLATFSAVESGSSWNPRLLVWDVRSRKILLDQKVMGFEIALDATGKTLAVGGQREVRFWNIEDGTELPKMRGLPGMVHSVAFAPDGSSFAAGTGDVAMGGMLKEDPDSEGIIFAMAFLESMTDREAARMFVWDMPLSTIGNRLPMDGKPVAGVDVGPGGRIAVGREESVEIWNAETRALERRIEVPKGSAAVVVLSPDGSKVLAGGADKIVRVWEASTGKSVPYQLKRSGEITVLSAFPDGKTVAVATRGDGAVAIWDYTIGIEKAVSFAESAGQSFMATGRKAPLLIRSNTGGVSITNDSSSRSRGVVTAFDPITGLRTRDFGATTGLVRGLALSADDRVLAVLSGDKIGGEAMQFFDVASGRETHHFHGDSEISTSLASTPDGQRIVQSSDGSIKFRDAATGRLLVSIPQWGGRLLFNPEGTRMIVVQANGVAVCETTPPPVPRPLPTEHVATGEDPPVSLDAEDDQFPKVSRDLMNQAEKFWADKDFAAANLFLIRAAESDPAPQRADFYRRAMAIYRQAAPLAGGREPSVPKTPLLPEIPLKHQCETRFGPGGPGGSGSLLMTTTTFGGRPHQLTWVDMQRGKPIAEPLKMSGEFFQEERNHVVMMPDGQRVFVYLTKFELKGKFKRWIERIELATGKSELRIDLPDWENPRYEDGDSWLSLSGDGKYVVFDEVNPGSSNQKEWPSPARTRAWDATTGKVLELPTRHVRLAFSPDGRFVLATVDLNADRKESLPTAVVYDLSTMTIVGKPITLSLKVDSLELTRGGKYVIAREPAPQPVIRVHSVAEGRCTLALKTPEKDLPHAVTPDGERIIVPAAKYKGKSVIEVRECATGKRKYMGTTLPSKPKHIEISPDGAFALVRMDDSTAQLVELDHVEPVGPPLPVTSSRGTDASLSSDRDMTFQDNGTFLLRLPFAKDQYLKQTRFAIFDYKSIADIALTEEKRRAELLSGRFVNASNVLEVLPLEEYRKRWASAKPEWLAEGAKMPEAVPGPPVVAGKAPPKPPRSKQAPDYAAIFARHGGADSPPLLSVAEAIRGASAANRKSAFSYLVLTRPEERRTLDLLTEGLNDDASRPEVLKLIESLGSKATPVVDRLLAEFELELKHGEVEKPLVRVLGRVGPAAKGAVPGLREYIRSFGPNSYSDVEEEAIRTLGRIGPAAKDALPDVVAKLGKFRQDRGSSIVLKAVERISEGRMETIVPHLETQLKPTPDEENDWRKPKREVLLEYIASIGTPLKEIAPSLRKIIAEPLSRNAKADYGVKLAAAEALWKVTGNVDEALPAIESELKRPVNSWPTSSITVAGRAALLLGRIGEPAKKNLPAIEDVLKKPRNLHDRVALAEAVWRLGGKPDGLLAACKERLETKSGYGGEESDKLAVVVLLGEVGPAAKSLVPLIQKQAASEAAADEKKMFRFTIIKTDEEDPDPNPGRPIRDAVATALKKINMAVKE